MPDRRARVVGHTVVDLRKCRGYHLYQKYSFT
jgi:hypothetical protein